MKKISALILVFLLIPQFSRAGWIDDWISQKTTSGANYLSNQKRGFGAFGNFSARWPQSNDYLMNISPPTFKAGCGGIDMFMGGYNFLQPDYLVQKLQGMVNAAPAVAFDIALSTVSQQVSNSLGKFEAIIDRLNALQLDDCKSSKAVVATIASGLSNNQAVQSYKTHAVADWEQSTGASDLWQQIKQTASAQPTADAAVTAAGGTPNKMVSACPAAMRTIFFAPNSSILQNILVSKGQPAQYAALLRGYLGDVGIDSTGTNYMAIAKCPENSPDHIDGLVNGQVYTRALWNGAGPPPACTQVVSVTINGTSYSSVETWIFTVLKGAADKMVARQPLTNEQTAFFSILPAPLYQSIITDLRAAGQDADTVTIAAMYTDTAASAYAMAIMSDLYDTIRNAIKTGKIAIANSQGAQGVGNNQCHLELAQPALGELEEMEKSLDVYLIASRNQYLTKMSELNAYRQYNLANNEAQQIINEEISKTFPGYTGGIL